MTIFLVNFATICLFDCYIDNLLIEVSLPVKRSLLTSLKIVI